jgi:hypothetical protein
MDGGHALLLFLAPKWPDFTFMWLALYALIGIIFVMNDTIRPRRLRLLPWVFFLSELWVFAACASWRAVAGWRMSCPAIILYSLVYFGDLVLCYSFSGFMVLLSVWWFAHRP